MHARGPRHEVHRRPSSAIASATRRRASVEIARFRRSHRWSHPYQTGQAVGGGYLTNHLIQFFFLSARRSPEAAYYSRPPHTSMRRLIRPPANYYRVLLDARPADSARADIENERTRAVPTWGSIATGMHSRTTASASAISSQQPLVALRLGICAAGTTFFVLP